MSNLDHIRAHALGISLDEPLREPAERRMNDAVNFWLAAEQRKNVSVRQDPEVAYWRQRCYEQAECYALDREAWKRREQRLELVALVLWMALGIAVFVIARLAVMR